MEEMIAATSYWVEEIGNKDLEHYLNDPSGCRIAAFRKKAAVRHLRNCTMSSPHDDRLSPICWTWP
jgi:hypothetical protein